MEILDGKTFGQNVRDTLKMQLEQIRQTSKDFTPGLAVILVGNDPASQAYVNMKKKACEQAGFLSQKYELDSEISESNLLELIAKLNYDEKIHGILVQLPLPKHISTEKILESINPQKDVDGFHPYNIGRLSANLPCFTPATPLGVMQLLAHYKIDVKGKDVAIIGASNIVGKPLAYLMLNAGASVSVCHILTRDVRFYTRNADIVCVGVGKTNLITADMIKDGAVVVDIGINRLPNGKIVGDVDFENVSKKASFITPVPGGVGPMTIAMLLQNTLEAAKQTLK